MSSLTDYKGLQVLTPDPVGAGGLAINNNFKHLADSFQSARRDSTLTINSTSLATSGLSFDVKNGDTWRFEFNLFATSLNSSADLRLQVDGPGNGRCSFINIEIAQVRSAALNSLSSTLSVDTGSDDLIQVNGIMEATSDGTVELRLRNNSTSTPQTFSEWSYFIAQRID